MVTRLAPFQRTTDALTKPLPATVNVNALEPAAIEAGDNEEITGAAAGVITENAAPPDTPPPGAGLATVTVADPEAATSAAVIAAASCVALTNVVVRLVPFH